MLPGWAVILLLFALVAAAFALVRIAGQWGEKKESGQAVALSKRMETVPRGKLYQTPATAYFALFRLEDGREVELHMEGRDWSALREGDRGQLSFRGKEFQNFRPL